MANHNLANVLNVDDPVAAAECSTRWPSTSSVRSGDGMCSGPVSPTSSSPSPRPPTGTRPPRAINDNPNRHLFADDEFFITTHAWFSALRGDADVADELLGQVERRAGERGPPGHRHGGHRASVRGDGAQRPWRGAALESHLRRAGRAGPVVRRRRRTVGLAAGRPVCPRARRSHRRGGAARHLRAAPARPTRADAARRSAADPRPPRRRGSRPPTPPTNSSSAVEALRSISTPYHLAHGLLDHAEFPRRRRRLRRRPSRPIAEARSIATGLGCRPLLDRADALAAPAVRPPSQER